MFKEIDTSIVKNTSGCVAPQVKYTLYNEKGDDIGSTIPKKSLKKNAACFANLLNELVKKDLNRIAYKPGKIRTTNEVAEQWIKIAQENKFLPQHVKPEDLKENFVLKPEKNRNLLYIYLCVLRCLKEEPDFVRSVVHMVVDHKIDMCAAIALASPVTHNSGGHHFVDVRPRSYGSSLNINKIKISLHHIIGLKRFLTHPEKHMPSSNNRFSCQSMISSISSVKMQVSVRGVRNKHILAAINSETDEQANKEIAKFKIKQDLKENKEPELKDSKLKPRRKRKGLLDGI